MTFYKIFLLFPLLLAAVAGKVFASETTPSTVNAVKVTDEPLHVVRYRSPQFLIYTNWIEPGVWTLYHRHATDLLAVIAAASAVASQVPGAEPEEQAAPAGSVVFFPYGDGAAPYVHRVGARGDSPFINVGLDFQAAPVSDCESEISGWQSALATEIVSNRRGSAYRFTLPPNTPQMLPESGNGLLLVPLEPAALQIDDKRWEATVGDFRFFESYRPVEIKNTGQSPAVLVMFHAC